MYTVKMSFLAAFGCFGSPGADQCGHCNLAVPRIDQNHHSQAAQLIAAQHAPVKSQKLLEAKNRSVHTQQTVIFSPNSQIQLF